MTKDLNNTMSNHKILTDNLSSKFDSEADLIPLLTPEDEEEMNNRLYPNYWLFYSCEIWFYFLVLLFQLLQDDKSIKLINDANAAGKTLVSLHKSTKRRRSTKNDIHRIGTVARIFFKNT
jgi:ATP-dependent Lon protease